MNPLPKEMTQAYERDLRNQGESGNWKPIRILADYSNIKSSIMNATYLSFVENKFLPGAISFLTSAI